MDAGKAGAGPAVLIVVTPGFPADSHQNLVRVLERHGLDAWTLAFPLAAQNPEQMVGAQIPTALAELRGVGNRKVALVGHGLGGRLAAQAVASGAALPDALALLGVPLDLAVQGDRPLDVVAWLASLPVPDAAVDLAPLSAASWKDLPVLPLLLGEPLPALEPVSGAWLRSLAAEVGPGHAVSLANAPCPVWEGTSPRDNLAPPETARGGLGDGVFVRFGYLRLDPREPDHLGLLRDPIPARVLADWTAATLR